jgi:hypothetical protein
MDTQSVGLFPQIIAAVAVTAVIFFVYMGLEILYSAYLNYGSARIEVYPYTGNTNKVFTQDPSSTSANTLTLPLSDNQLTGIEFSYSTFVYISDNNSSAPPTDTWKSLFYKGYESSPFPLCGPGVFVSTSHGPNSSPTLRVIMNTYDTWFNTIDVPEIPVNKWIHLALVLRKNALYIYVNGNLANKKSFNGTLPYQNYQPLILFPTATTLATDFTTAASETASRRGIPPGENFTVTGPASGYLSNMFYFTYAMTYSEIQAMMAMGPSSTFDTAAMTPPPYLIDTWWTNRPT